MTNRIWVAAIAIGLMLCMRARAQNIIRCTKTLDGLNEYITSFREARDDYLTSRNQALRLLPRRGSLSTTEALEYEDAVHNVVSKQMYVESHVYCRG